MAACSKSCGAGVTGRFSAGITDKTTIARIKSQAANWNDLRMDLNLSGKQQIVPQHRGLAASLTMPRRARFRPLNGQKSHASIFALAKGSLREWRTCRLPPGICERAVVPLIGAAGLRNLNGNLCGTFRNHFALDRRTVPPPKSVVGPQAQPALGLCSGLPVGAARRRTWRNPIEIKIRFQESAVVWFPRAWSRCLASRLPTNCKANALFLKRTASLFCHCYLLWRNYLKCLISHANCAFLGKVSLFFLEISLFPGIVACANFTTPPISTTK